MPFKFVAIFQIEIRQEVARYFAFQRRLGLVKIRVGNLNFFWSKLQPGKGLFTGYG
jgi:hypothetical protein